MVAAAQGYTAMIRPLLQAGAIVEAKDAQGQTAVARARQKNHAFIVQLLEEVAAQQ
jgi:ankyrin repeat protein